MSSNIDITKPVNLNPSLKSIRDNFSIAKTEIENLQDNKADANFDNNNNIVKILDKNNRDSGIITIKKYESDKKSPDPRVNGNIKANVILPDTMDGQVIFGRGYRILAVSINSFNIAADFSIESNFGRKSDVVQAETDPVLMRVFDLGDNIIPNITVTTGINSSGIIIEEIK